MGNIGTLPGDRLAGLSADLFHKIQAGVISLDDLAGFINQPKGRPVFEYNEHGHVIITFTGLDLMGAQEVERLEASGFSVNSCAKSCFLSTAKDSYDKSHRLVGGQQYKIALVPGKEIEQQFQRTTKNLRALGTKYGYGKPLGGHIARSRESVTDKQMEEWGIWYIASLHDPIKDSDGNPFVLRASRGDEGRQVGTYWVNPDRQWSGLGAFAFPVVAS